MLFSKAEILKVLLKQDMLSLKLQVLQDFWFQDRANLGRFSQVLDLNQEASLYNLVHVKSFSLESMYTWYRVLT